MHESSGLAYAILGLLSIRPMSGYDIKKHFQRSLNLLWNAPLTQIYPTLRQLEAQGLVEGELTVQDNRPNKRVFRLTEGGHAVLVDWLRRPSELRVLRHEYLSKLFLLNLVGPAEALAQVEGYLGRSKALLEQLYMVREKFSPALDGPYHDTARFQLLSLAHIIRLTEAEVEACAATAQALREQSAPNSADDERQGEAPFFAEANRQDTPRS